jgi:hypothetical protein
MMRSTNARATTPLSRNGLRAFRGAVRCLGLSIAMGLIVGCGDEVKDDAAKQSADPPGAVTETSQGTLGSPPATPTLDQQGDQVSGGAAAGASERDSRLIGRWKHTDAGRSGTFTYAVDTHFALNEDGTYRYGDSKAGTGDASSTAIANGGKAEVGQWRTENKILSLKPDGNPAWARVGRYAVDATHLMLTYKNGSKKIWERE